MEFTEIIGFLIVLFVFLVPVLRKLLLDKKRVEQKEVEQNEEEFEEVYIIEEEPMPQVERRPPRTERLVKRDYAFETEFGEKEFDSKITERELETRVAPEFKKRIVSEEFILETNRARRKANPLVAIVKKRKPTQAMVILSEILNRKDR